MKPTNQANRARRRRPLGKMEGEDLVYWASPGNLPEVKKLLNEGMNPDVLAIGGKWRGMTALVVTSIIGYPRIVKLLLEHGANPSRATIKHRRTALISASSVGHTDNCETT